KEFFIDEKEFFDPDYDFDFTNLSDSADCMRGNETYERPKGWYRMALKVKGKYPEGDAWLGTNGWRSNSVPGEWPVSYHGTGLEGERGIISSHYKAGDGQVYGRGIYSTPELHEAEKYSKTFTSGSTGKTYTVIMQNRINPKKRQICDKYWLIPVPEGTSADEEKRIVESSIRPYGVLIKE
uniref:PARP catalytic domain-containing protein n=1 Tax=Poecilia formosa TaxID=48698 RepID=A0A096MCF3_POEFO